MQHPQLLLNPKIIPIVELLQFLLSISTFWLKMLLKQIFLVSVFFQLPCSIIFPRISRPVPQQTCASWIPFFLNRLNHHLHQDQATYQYYLLWLKVRFQIITSFCSHLMLAQALPAHLYSLLMSYYSFTFLFFSYVLLHQVCLLDLFIL